MQFVSMLRRTLGLVKVTEANGVIIVDGVNTEYLKRMITKMTQTAKVANNIIIRSTGSSFAFPSFYAIEINFLLLKIIAAKDSWGLSQIAQQIIQGLKTDTWLRCTVEQHPSMVDLKYLANLKISLRPHQKEFLQVYGTMVPKYGLRGYLLASKPGSGKTIADLAVAACVIPRSIAQVKIIISPKNAVGLVWEATVREVFKKVPTSWTSDSAGDAPFGREYYIFHYEAMDRALRLAALLASQGIKYFVIIDESHNFNRLEALRTRQLIAICTTIPGTYQIWASGTPVKAMGIEIMPLLMSIDPRFDARAAAVFKKAFNNDKVGALEVVSHRFGIITYKPPNVQTTTTPPVIKNIPIKLDNPKPFLLETITQDMKAFFEERVAFYQKDMVTYRQIFEQCILEHRATLVTSDEKALFNKWLSVIAQIRADSISGKRVDPTMQQWAKQYEADILIPSLSGQSARAFLDVRTIVKSLRQKVQGESLGVYGRRRAECATALAMQADLAKLIMDAEGKTIIFSTYTAPLSAASKKLTAQGFRPIHVFGEDTALVTKQVGSFTEIGGINPCLATFAGLSTAVPVIIANTEIILDFPPRDFIFQQAIARVARMGQTKPCFIWCLILDTGDIPNISTRGADILEWSKTTSEIIMGDDMGADLDSLKIQ